jgi:thiol-disulfide isomerase/thioredoxin
LKTIIYSVIIALIVFTSCKKERTYFLQNDYNLVLKAAKHNKKLVFLDFYTVWCGGCKSYEKFVFTDSIFLDYLKTNFYSARINAELQENKIITNKYSIGAYPTLIIADFRGNEIDRIIGYKIEYGENCKLLIDKINRILKGEETLNAMIKKFDANPDSLQLLLQIVSEEFIDKSDYKNLKKFALESINKNKNSKLKEVLNFFYGYASINDKSEQNPNILKEILQSGNSLDSMFIEGGYSELLKYYESKENKDSIDYCYSILINLKSQEYLGYARDYAKFLYENNIKIDLADKLTDDYAKYPGSSQDHWTPFLKAHSLARHGKLREGVKLFDDWMSKNSNPNTEEIDLWNYYFYVDFALFYNTNFGKALEYAVILEKNQPVVDYKMLLAKVLYLNNKNKEAINKLNEIIPMIENAELKQRVDKLILDYKD